MFCQNCGAKASDESLHCPECGAKIEVPIELGLGSTRLQATVKVQRAPREGRPIARATNRASANGSR